jgi:3-hydroxyisobutyrate dehydrogenase
MEAQSLHVAFAGLGAMGFGMASNLLKAGVQVNGFDVNPNALTRFAALGGSTSSTVRDACAGCTKFLVMVASPEQVDSLVFPKDGLIDSLPEGAILCLLSTLPPDYVIKLNKKLAALGRADIRLVDCPVSGGVVGANAGTLSVRAN